MCHNPFLRIGSCLFLASHQVVAVHGVVIAFCCLVAATSQVETAVLLVLSVRKHQEWELSSPLNPCGNYMYHLLE
jgi:hypothetical protein